MYWRGLLVCGLSFAVVSRAAETPQRAFTAQDLFGIRRATDPQVRPDGKAIAYVRMSGDIMTDRFQSSIWLVNTATGVQSPAVTDESANITPRWSPDGTRIAYVKLDTQAQIDVYWTGSGRSAKVARSPLSQVGRVSTPTMLLVGDQDYRTPTSEAEQFYQALQLRAVPTSLVLIPGAGHGGPSRPSQSAARVAAIVGWFQRFSGQ